MHHSASFGSPYLDFGARQYDPEVASWLAPDPLATDYPGLSPYVYCAGDPGNRIDIMGEKIVFVHGLPAMGAKPGRAYWGESFIRKAMASLNDNNIDVASYSYDWKSSALDRRKAGYEYAKNSIKRLTSDIMKGESFRFVSHSMGAAFSEGMAEYLIESGYDVDIMIHLSPFQADDINSIGDSPNILTIDFQTIGDPVLKLGLFSQGEIKGADSVKRLKSSYSFFDRILYSHTESLYNKTWDEILPIINEFLNHNNK